MREELMRRTSAKLVRAPGTAARGAASADRRGGPSVPRGRSRDHRLHAMFVVFALLGLRRSEVLDLRWEDVDLEIRRCCRYGVVCSEWTVS